MICKCNKIKTYRLFGLEFNVRINSIYGREHDTMWCLWISVLIIYICQVSGWLFDHSFQDTSWVLLLCIYKTHSLHRSTIIIHFSRWMPNPTPAGKKTPTYSNMNLLANPRWCVLHVWLTHSLTPLCSIATLQKGFVTTSPPFNLLDVAAI